MADLHHKSLKIKIMQFKASYWGFSAYRPLASKNAIFSTGPLGENPDARIGIACTISTLAAAELSAHIDRSLAKMEQREGVDTLLGKTSQTASSPILKQVCMRESGASTYLRNISQDIIDVLRIHFPQNYREIFTLAICRLMHQSPLKNIEFLYENSMLSEEFRGLDLSKNRLTTLIQEWYAFTGGSRSIWNIRPSRYSFGFDQ